MLVAGLAGLLIPTLKDYLNNDKLVHPFPWWTRISSSITRCLRKGGKGR